MIIYSPGLDVYGIVVKRKDYMVNGRLFFMDIAKIMASHNKSEIGLMIAVAEDDTVFEGLMVE